MVSPIVDGPTGDEGTDGIWGAITDTVSGVIRGAGDYLHEKFLGRNQYPGSDQAYYAPYGPGGTGPRAGIWPRGRRRKARRLCSSGMFRESTSPVRPSSLRSS